MRPLDININIPNVEEVKAHVKKHQVAYSFGAGAVVAGFTCLIMRGAYAGIQRVPGGSDTIHVKPLAFFSRQNVTTVIEREGRGHPGYIIQCLETGKIFRSQIEAAANMNVYPSLMSGHLNGKFPDVHGYHFERI
ncbi:MAG TPA: hypothetical protein VGE97_00380, partial [Nitrososphaera sp.]